MPSAALRRLLDLLADRAARLAAASRGRARRGAGLAAMALAAAVAAGAGAAPGAAEPLDLGEENSWLRIQNVGQRAATVEIRFFDLGGGEVAQDRCPREGGCTAVPPGFGWSFFQQGYEQQGYEPLEAGYRGSATITVDQPFVALLARDAFEDGSFRIAGDTLRLGAGSSSQYAPLVQNTASHVSRLSIRNADDEQPACFEIAYYAEGASEPILDPGEPTEGCPRGGWRVPPSGTLLRDERTLPADFDGAAVVRSRPTAEGAPPGAQQPSLLVDTRERGGPGLAAYRAFDAAELSRDLVLPLVDRNASEGRTTWTTRFRLVAAEPEGQPIAVSLLFAGRDAAGDEIEIEHELVLASVLTCDQRLDGAGGCLPEDAALPDVFFGSVRVRAAEPVAIVAQRLSAGGALADYRGFTAEEASRELVLPVLNKNFGPWGGHDGWNSWFRVLSFDGSRASLRVLYYSKHFPHGLLAPPLAVDGRATLRQWENSHIPDGWVGSAILIADRPVVALANLESDVFEGDPVMLYNAVPQ